MRLFRLRFDIQYAYIHTCMHACIKVHSCRRGWRQSKKESNGAIERVNANVHRKRVHTTTHKYITPTHPTTHPHALSERSSAERALGYRGNLSVGALVGNVST
mmetsp:Transcript_30620/g.72236  ORF Transcript_30620/g.72236 Transcript_30620/m.72236 type:complete len:103 (+) Transcript_30620:1822-2130(+)